MMMMLMMMLMMMMMMIMMTVMLMIMDVSDDSKYTERSNLQFKVKLKAAVANHKN